MTLGVLNVWYRLIEPHGLVVEHGGSERRKVVAFQEGAGIGDESKTGSVRFRKSIEREGSNGLNDPVLRGSFNSLRRQKIQPRSWPCEEAAPEREALRACVTAWIRGEDGGSRPVHGLGGGSGKGEPFSRQSDLAV